MTRTVRRPFLSLAACFAAAACGSAPDTDAGAAAGNGASGQRPWQSPPTRTDSVVDDYHGTKVADPYRWLEKRDTPEVAAWMNAQNLATRSFLDAVPGRAEIRARLEQLWNYPRFAAPQRSGPVWVYMRNDGLQHQPALWITSDLAAPGELLLDPNQLATDGSVTLGQWSLDDLGQHMAYATTGGGSEWLEWHVLDLRTRQPLPDVLRRSKFSGATWTSDGKGFFYQRYPAAKEGEGEQAQARTPQLCYHRLGTAQTDDRVVYERPDQADWGFGSSVTDDGRYLVIHIWVGSDNRNRIAWVDLQSEPWTVQPLLMQFDAHYDFLTSNADTFFFLTDKDAPKGRVVAMPLQETKAEQWSVVVPESADTLQRVKVIGDRLVLVYLQDACHRLLVRKLDGADDGEIALPGLGRVDSLDGSRRDSEAFFTFTSFLQGGSIERYRFADKQRSVYRAPQLAFDASKFTTRRVFPQSRDGTRLCLFLVHKKGLRLDGSHRAYLFGYGGFGESVAPFFSVANCVWLERGGILALAVLRGGGEYGETWHQAGMLDNKQNVFDDLVACAEYLVRNGYSSRSRLALGGESNGGLAACAVLTQRPELASAVVAEAAVLDMLRYQESPIGWAWASEYGRSDDPKQFATLMHYSPLHNVKDGTHYPATLLMTGDQDERVLPAHSMKFAARLQAAQAGPAPILLRVEREAGHAAGSQAGDPIEAAADRWAFLTAVLQ